MIGIEGCNQTRERPEHRWRGVAALSINARSTGVGEITEEWVNPFFFLSQCLLPNPTFTPPLTPSLGQP